MKPDIVCGLDIGASFIRAAAAEVLRFTGDRPVDTPMRGCRVLGLSESPTEGFAKGVVTNLRRLSEGIEDTLSRLEKQSGRTIRKVVVNLSGAHIKNFKSRGSVSIAERPVEITENDIRRCIESAKLIALSLDREVIHLVPKRFFIDDKIEIDDPLGLFGSKLDVELNIVTSLISILQNLTKAVNLAGYEVEEIVVSSTGTSLAVFEGKELEEGCVLIDIGKDVTELAVFQKRRLEDCFYFPYGADDLTQALQERLKIMFNEAELIKARYGIVPDGKKELFDDIQIPLPSARYIDSPGSDNAQSDHNRSGGNWAGYRSDARALFISRVELSGILSGRLRDIMQDVRIKLAPFLKTRKRLPCIYVSGRTAKMDGLIETLEGIFNVPVQMARIKGEKDIIDISFATCIGLARHAASRLRGERAREGVFRGRLGAIAGRVKRVFSEYF